MITIAKWEDGRQYSLFTLSDLSNLEYISINSIYLVYSMVILSKGFIIYVLKRFW